MTLKTKNIKTYIPKIIWGVIILLVAIFFLKVYFWEEHYYAEKEGSERAASGEIVHEEEIDETEPTEEEVVNWAANLPSNYPAYISIGAIGQIGRQVAPVGTTADGEMGTPNNVFQIGWFDTSGTPGSGGTLVMDGHNGGPNVQGVLKQLPLLCTEGEVGVRSVPGDSAQGTRNCDGTPDMIAIERADGASFAYKVVENVTIPLSESDNYMTKAFSTPVHGKESLTLITCTGEWSQTQGTYLSRQFLRAILN